LISLYPILPGF